MIPCKRRWIWLLTFGIYLISFSKSQAQIQAPDLICVSGDTLFFAPTTMPCGPFNGFEIYSSTNPTGPFTLLTTLLDPNATQYIDLNPTGETRYYYMQSDLDCPGQNQLASDTLNNRPPDVVPIELVTVVDNDIAIEWLPSTSPDVVGYIIYLTTDLGVIPIDTIFGDTQYLDVTTNASDTSLIYNILALDACGGTGVFNAPHETIFLQIDNSNCSSTVGLNWNLYQNWPAGIERQELWVSIAGNPFEVVDTLPPDQTAYTYQLTQDNVLTCFEIRAYREGADFVSQSNRVCGTFDINLPAYITNITYTPDNNIEVEWVWDDAAILVEADLLLQTDADGEEVAEVLATNPLQQSNQLEVIMPPLEEQLTYLIQTLDDCDTLHRSNAVSPIFISGTANADRTNTLTWTPLDRPDVVVTSYSLWRILGSNNPRRLDTFTADSLSYLDIIDPDDPLQASTCYYVIAEGVLTLPDGNTTRVITRSNTLCLQQESVILIPNAFVPGSFNGEFKPLITFSENVDFQMIIFDRWGRKQFETQDLLRGWDGRVNGTDMPEGVYTYFIQVTQADGTEIKRGGPFILLR